VNVLPLIVKESRLKSGSPKIAAMSGVSRFSTNAAMTAPNAAPMTTATARSTTFPRIRKSRNSFRIAVPRCIERPPRELTARRLAGRAIPARPGTRTSAAGATIDVP
jgi:hypothetical protein